MSYTGARVVLSLANFTVAALNAVAALESREARDWLAALAWTGSGTFWIWQAVANA